MKVAVAGAGKVGRFLAEELAVGGHDVLLIEKDPALASSLDLPEGVRTVAADACEVTSLLDARVDEAEVMVAVTGDDEDNLVISLLAKQEFAVPRVIARVNHPRNHWLFNESWGVDVAVSTPQLLAGLVEEAVSVGVLVRLLQFEGGNTRLIEVTLAEGSPAQGAAVADLGLPRGATVVALVRDGHVVVPRSDMVLDVGDEVLLLASAQIEDDELRQLLAPTALHGPHGLSEDGGQGSAASS
ncbi:MAG: NAD-binding protein [Actinomycetota bacterium]|nr:NAD-binding protein [Actinomycetota bacterium]